MEIKSEQSTDNPDAEDAAVKDEAAPTVEEEPAGEEDASDAVSEEADAPVAEPTEQPLTMQEVGVSLGKAKDEFVGAIAEPARKALGRWSQMARDTLSGAVGGFLGNKKRED